MIHVLALTLLQAAQPASAPRDLRDVFARGYILQDRNADDVVDFVFARLVLPTSPSEADIASAANVAARLGYETSATDLGLTVSDTLMPAGFAGPLILFGSGNAVLARAGAAPTRGLAPGEGSIRFLPSSAELPAGAVLIDGYDASGQLAAAAYFAARYPSVWSLRGETYTGLAQRIERFVERAGAGGAQVTLENLVVAAGAPGVLRASARVMLADSAAVSRVVAALQPADSASAPSSPRDSASRGPGAHQAAGLRAGAAGQVRDTTRAAPTDLHVTDLQRLDLVLAAPGVTRTLRVAPPRPWQTRVSDDPAPRDMPDFTLSDLFTIRGLFRDTNQDLVPDRTEAFLSIAGTEAAAATIDLSQRIGLETAGIRLPLVRVEGQRERPQDDGLPIVIGLQHDQLARLRQERLLRGLTEGAGTGFVEMTPRAFGGRHGVVISGADASGLDAVTNYVATRFPYLWDFGKGNYRLSDVEQEVRRFFQVKDAPGQVALALFKLDQWLTRLGTGDVDSVAVEIVSERAPDGLAAEVERRLRTRFPAARVSAAAHPAGFGAGDTIFAEELEIPWEVDIVRDALRDDVLPRLTADSRGRIEVRVSEPPEVRRQLASEIREELGRRGLAGGAFDVLVLNAYKQGYSWLEEVVLPKLRGQRVGRIEIGYHTLRDSKEVRWQAIEAETRWLQEIYPIDAVFARELGIADSLVVFTPTQRRDPVYTLRALDRSGREILRESFDPKYVVRPYFDLFPEYEEVRVTTGWLHVLIDGDTVLDQRVRTDPEAFWEHLQTRTYGRIIDYVMDTQDGRPSPANAPYFDELRIDLTLSEPNHRIGIDEEVISSLEALHEDIYFETLTLFDLIGGRYGVGPLNYAGRVLPYMHDRPGQRGRARITLTGKQRGVPELVLTHRRRGGEPFRQRYPLAPLPVETPRLRGVSIRAGEEGIAQLLFQVVAHDSIDRYEEHRTRSSESAIDRTLLPVELLEGMVNTLRELHAARVLSDALSLDRVARLAFHFTLSDTTSDYSSSSTLPRSAQPRSTQNPRLSAGGWQYDGRPLVQWHTPIPPAENDSVLAKLATLPGVNAYFITRSFLGQNTFAADFLPPVEARYLSQAKLNALKPTLLISGRQHANEVSSTSHILRLGELLATDSAYAALLKKVNVVLHPVTNPDGAQLAYEMQLENPDFMLHAGYLGALGVDVTAGANAEDPIYPEAKARPELQETWLPDIFMNMHGYPSHEWVQYFAGYSAWVRGRTGAQRSWWLPRGWFVPGFNWVDDARYPEIRTAQFAILDSVAGAITRDTRIEAMNRRLYARYAKYGRQDVDNFREHFHNGILVYSALRGREVSGTGFNNPRITYFAVTTEAPDETARGDWLHLVASAGLAHSTALLRYLASGRNRIERETSESARFIHRSVFRKKPILPEDS